MIIKRICKSDDLVSVCAELANDQWGDDNDMAVYKPEEVLRFVEYEKNLLVVGYEDRRIVCSALCYALAHPDVTRRSLYIDEIDTHPQYRRKGFASEMLMWLRAYASEENLTEVWLTTEAKNNSDTNSFYESLKPDESLVCNLYSYKPKQG